MMHNKNEIIKLNCIMSVYDEIEIEDMDFHEDTKKFYYPCPCGDKFVITLDQIKRGEVIA